MPGDYRNKHFCLVTLGCPKNQVDSEVLAALLSGRGANLVENADDADVILINTCGFIEDAKQESIDTILQAIQMKNASGNREVYVWGCLSERYKDQIGAEIPEVDGFFGVEAFGQMGTYFLGETAVPEPEIYGKRILTTPSHVAYLKIAEGCDHDCTFCAIPQFKGRYRSRSPESLVDEAAALAERGVKELILIAQDTTRYGTDLPVRTTLTDLLLKLTRLNGIQWIRIMYAHPGHVDDGLIEVMAGEDKICRYLDMPLQHIAEPMLRSMGRGGSRTSIERLIDRCRNRISGLVLRSAFIVGFPGETPAYFNELLDFIRNVKFERLGAFIYSPEEGTPAFAMENSVNRSTAEARYHRLMQEQMEISEALNDSLIHTVQRVMIDEYDSGQALYIGRTQGDCLEIDQNVWVRGHADIGRIVPVLIESSDPYDLFGHVRPDL